jgi:hypothetical protein
MARRIKALNAILKNDSTVYASPNTLSDCSKSICPPCAMRLRNSYNFFHTVSLVALPKHV